MSAPSWSFVTAPCGSPLAEKFLREGFEPCGLTAAPAKDADGNSGFVLIVGLKRPVSNVILARNVPPSAIGKDS